MHVVMVMVVVMVMMVMMMVMHLMGHRGGGWRSFLRDGVSA
jgi:hypothetical protein